MKVMATGSIVGWGWEVVVEEEALDGLIAVAGGYSLSPGLRSSSTSAVEEPGPGHLPGTAVIAILSLAPNPFNESTRISFETRGSGHVIMEVYDVMGRRVRTVPLGSVGPGLNRAGWDGSDASGDKVLSGVYFVRLHCADGGASAVKAVVVR